MVRELKKMNVFFRLRLFVLKLAVCLFSSPVRLLYSRARLYGCTPTCWAPCPIYRGSVQRQLWCRSVGVLYIRERVLCRVLHDAPPLPRSPAWSPHVDEKGHVNHIPSPCVMALSLQYLL